MAWIRWIDEADSEGPLRETYERYGGPHGIDHILKIHSLNPPSLDHHYRLYEHLMRGPSGLSRGEREMIAVVVSVANDCFY
jgi:alkylhydroperoxidase family enzyme